jgi:D-sedoheptulose 7-phosphate isomerase
MPAQYFSPHFSEHRKVIDASIASLQPASDAAAEAIISSLGRGGKVLAFGNGGSATQASHLVEELIGRFKETRRPLPAISLVSDAGVVTCIANDFGYGALFERQVEALAAMGDVVVGITTSGRSENVLRGLKAGKDRVRLQSPFAENTGCKVATPTTSSPFPARRVRTSRKFT